MSQLANVKNVTKTLTNRFPRINKAHFIETSIEHTYTDVFFPVNNVDNDRFCEFRIPRTLGNFIDMGSINLQFNLNVKKKKSHGGAWTQYEQTVSGDHYDLVNLTSYCVFKSLSIEMNGVQVTNDSNYALNSYIRLITQFPYEEVDKIGKLFHLENYDKIVKSIADDSYFSALGDTSAISKRLVKIRDKGLFLRAPLITDICNISSYLLDGVDIVIRLTLQENNAVFFTAQQQPNLAEGNPKKYFYDIADISLHVKKIKPTDNAYAALHKTLLPKINDVPTLDYVFTSKIVKQYHLPAGQNEHHLDLPFSSTIPERLYVVFQSYDNYQTRQWDENLLYLEHLNLSNVYITINGTTIYNIKCDFESGNVAELYNTTLLCLDKDHLLTYDKFINGMTILGFPLAVFDQSADIRSPFHGVLRITLTFKGRLADAAMAYMLGDVLSILSINNNRDITLNKN